MRLINTILFLFAIQIGYVKADDGFKYTLNSSESEEVYLMAINTGSNKNKLPFNFCISSLGDLTFEIKDKEGNKYPLSSMINDRCNPHKEVYVEPFSLVGKVFHKSGIKSYYSLPKSEFLMKAILCDKERECEESNEVKVTFSNK